MELVEMCTLFWRFCRNYGAIDYVFIYVPLFYCTVYVLITFGMFSIERFIFRTSWKVIVQFEPQLYFIVKSHTKCHHSIHTDKNTYRHSCSIVNHVQTWSSVLGRNYDAYYPSYTCWYSDANKNYKLTIIQFSDPFLCKISTSTSSMLNLPDTT